MYVYVYLIICMIIKVRNYSPFIGRLFKLCQFLLNYNQNPGLKPDLIGVTGASVVISQQAFETKLGKQSRSRYSCDCQFHLLCHQLPWGHTILQSASIVSFILFNIFFIWKLIVDVLRSNYNDKDGASGVTCFFFKYASMQLKRFNDLFF